MRHLVWLGMLIGCRFHFDEQLAAVDDDAALADATADVDAHVCTVELGAARQHVTAIFDDGSLRVWGDGNFGQIGDGAMADRPSPTPVTLPASVVSAGGGRWNTCAALASGEVQCWGEGDSGQLGDGNSATTPTPVTAVGITSAVEVAPAADHGCARLASGEITCWGAGGFGRLGRGDTTSSATPVPVPGITTAIAVRAGGSTTCVILNDGSPRCWGYNGDGGVGVNSTTHVLSPMQPIGLATVRSISPRDQTTCAVRGDGAVFCFGSNNAGQAGSPSGGADLLVPTAVEQQNGDPLIDADEVGQGIDFGCARIGSAVWCWGNDNAGQLGDGSAGAGHAYATPVIGLPPVFAISVSAYSACAVDAGAGVWCWGAGPEGELGDGTRTAARATPQLSFDACP